MLSISSIFMIFVMLTLSSFAVFGARWLKIPHTVILVGIGTLLGLLSLAPGLSFLSSFQLTPELLFFGFLPTLIFESAYNISLRKLSDDSVVVGLLSVVGLIISATIIGLVLHGVFSWIGVEVPLVATLLFGALISATDTAAVLALFKEYGAPRRLSLIFEGESLFNDATAVALFLVILGVGTTGYEGFSTVFEGISTFTIMLSCGIFFGLLVGVVFAELVNLTRTHEAASITLTIVLAHITFLTAEYISHTLFIGGYQIHVSPIVATTVASLVMGNYGRPKIHPRAEVFVEKLWGQLAFMVNSIIFIQIGLLLVLIPFTVMTVYIILIAVVVVATTRAISIYLPLGVFNSFAPDNAKVPREWQHLLSWGSLRGAFSISLVLLIPEDFELAGWTLSIGVRDFLLTLTVGCIFATTFIKAPTIQGLMRRLKLDTPTDIESLEYQEARALIHQTVSNRLALYAKRGYISQALFKDLNAEHIKEYRKAVASVRRIDTNLAADLTKRVIRIFAIGIEKRYLKELYHYDEINERMYKRIIHKLSYQLEAIEHGTLEPNARIKSKKGDVVDRFVDGIRRYFIPLPRKVRITDAYVYYRAQTIISRKVQKELGGIDLSVAESIFTKEALDHVMLVYDIFREQTQQKMRELEASYPEVVRTLERKLATQGISKVEEHTLNELIERELVTPKLYLNLKEELGIK